MTREFSALGKAVVSEHQKSREATEEIETDRYLAAQARDRKIRS